MWPPEYSVRKSKKAKNISLKITPHKGLEVVVPYYYRRAFNIEKIINENKNWINNNILILNKANEPVFLPHELNLLAVNELWKVKYFKTDGRSYCATSDTINTIIVNHKDVGVNEDTIENINTNLNVNSNHNINLKIEAIKKMLKNWLQKKALKILFPWVVRLSEQHNLPFKNLQIRGQKTIWGSCNSDHTINLNYKLIFLPPAFTQHIILHELSHTKYMSHGKKFKDLMQKIDLNYQYNVKEIKKADQYIPSFLSK